MARGALTFGSTGAGAADRVDIASSTKFDNLAAGTICEWVTLTTSTGAAQRNYDKSGRVLLLFGAVGNNLQFSVARATQSLSATANTTSFANFGYNKKLLIVATWDTAGTSSAQRLYMGDLDSVPAEPTSYATQRAGTGAQTADTTGSVVLGNSSSNNLSYHGTISHHALFPVQLTTAQIAAWWRTPANRVGASTAVQFYRLGQSTGTQINLASPGTGDGTVTGAVQADGPPIFQGDSFIMPGDVLVAGTA